MFITATGLHIVEDAWSYAHTVVQDIDSLYGVLGHVDDYDEDDRTLLRTTASEWHSGQGSALYSFASTGTIVDAWQLTNEIELCLCDSAAVSYGTELRDLLKYVQFHG